MTSVAVDDSEFALVLALRAGDEAAFTVRVPETRFALYHAAALYS